MSERLPRPEPSRVGATPPHRDELLRLATGTILVRVHPTSGPWPCAWDEFRFFGPTSSRFDHQTLPKRVHLTRGIAYVAHGESAFTAALAEYFQDGEGRVGPIDCRTNRPMITTFELAGDLVLLDLESSWVTRAGGNQAITSGVRSRSSEWARAVYRHFPVDGLSYGSSVWGPGLCCVVWERAAAGFPSSPRASRLLDDPYIAPALAKAAVDLGTYWV